MPKNIGIIDILSYMGWSYHDYMHTPTYMIDAIRIKMLVEYEEENKKPPENNG